MPLPFPRTVFKSNAVIIITMVLFFFGVFSGLAVSKIDITGCHPKARIHKEFLEFFLELHLNLRKIPC